MQIFISNGKEAYILVTNTGQPFYGWDGKIKPLCLLKLRKIGVSKNLLLLTSLKSLSLKWPDPEDRRIVYWTFHIKVKQYKNLADQYFAKERKDYQVRFKIVFPGPHLSVQPCKSSHIS